MKKILFATTALALSLSAGVASAEIALTGDARMGIVYDDNIDEAYFSSRARVRFTASGETDNGLSFGATFRVDHQDEAGGKATKGTAGLVYLEGAFGRLSMGDIDSGMETTLGDLAAVGYTTLLDQNEFFYFSDLEQDAFDLQSPDTPDDDIFYQQGPAILYTYAVGDFKFAASMTDGYADSLAISVGDILLGVVPIERTYSIGLGYVFGDYTVGIGYEKADAYTGDDYNQYGITLGANLFGAAVKGVYIGGDIGAVDVNQYGISASYTFDAFTVTGFYKVIDVSGGDTVITDNDDGKSDQFGLGVAYDLGGGAALKAGIVDSDLFGEDGAYLADFGVTFTF